MSPIQIHIHTMETPTKAEEIAASTDLYKATRGQIEHFENAINVRVIWLSIGQSFFFGVYASLISIKAPTPDLLAKEQLFTTIVPFAALLAVIFSLLDVLANIGYINRLRLDYEEATANIPSEQEYPFIWGERSDRIFQHTSTIVIPIIFIISWVIILSHTYHLV